jgi:hypothetical protein
MLGVDLARWTAAERKGFALFAPLLAQIDDLARWPKVDLDALAKLARARWANQERDYIAAMRAHDRLRNSLARAARRTY